MSIHNGKKPSRWSIRQISRRSPFWAPTAMYPSTKTVWESILRCCRCRARHSNPYNSSFRSSLFKTTLRFADYPSSPSFFYLSCFYLADPPVFVLISSALSMDAEPAYRGIYIRSFQSMSTHFRCG
jgi:hypothetical protein